MKKRRSQNSECFTAGVILQEGESEFTQGKQWKVLIRIFIVTRLFMNTFSVWKELQAALQVSRLRQLLDPLTAEMVLILGGWNKGLFVKWETVFFVHSYWSIQLYIFFSVLHNFYKVRFSLTVTALHQNDKKRSNCFSTRQLYIKNTHKWKINQTQKLCFLDCSWEKVSKKSLFVVCCIGVFSFPQTFHRRHVLLNVPGRTSLWWAVTAVLLLEAVQPRLQTKAAAAANSLVLLLLLCLEH